MLRVAHGGVVRLRSLRVAQEPAGSQGSKPDAGETPCAGLSPSGLFMPAFLSDPVQTFRV